MDAEDEHRAQGSPLRLDLFLKNAGLLKRRADAQEACRKGAVLVDGTPGRPGRQVRAGQRILLSWPRRLIEIEILSLPRRPVARENREECYRVIREEAREDDFWGD